MEPLFFYTLEEKLVDLRRVKVTGRTGVGKSVLGLKFVRMSVKSMLDSLYDVVYYIYQKNLDVSGWTSRTEIVRISVEKTLLLQSVLGK